MKLHPVRSKQLHADWYTDGRTDRQTWWSSYSILAILRTCLNMEFKGKFKTEKWTALEPQLFSALVCNFSVAVTHQERAPKRLVSWGAVPKWMVQMSDGLPNIYTRVRSASESMGRVPAKKWRLLSWSIGSSRCFFPRIFVTVSHHSLFNARKRRQSKTRAQN